MRRAHVQGSGAQIAQQHQFGWGVLADRLLAFTARGAFCAQLIDHRLQILESERCADVVGDVGDAEGQFERCGAEVVRVLLLADVAVDRGELQVDLGALLDVADLRSRSAWALPWTCVRFWRWGSGCRRRRRSW